MGTGIKRRAPTKAIIGKQIQSASNVIPLQPNPRSLLRSTH
ncbi:hypothetical protein V1282_000613 [Nitrobacteraceae bacterium AZCC 2146]